MPGRIRRRRERSGAGRRCRHGGRSRDRSHKQKQVVPMRSPVRMPIVHWSARVPARSARSGRQQRQFARNSARGSWSMLAWRKGCWPRASERQDSVSAAGAVSAWTIPFTHRNLHFSFGGSMPTRVGLFKPKRGGIGPENHDVEQCAATVQDRPDRQRAKNHPVRPDPKSPHQTRLRQST